MKPYKKSALFEALRQKARTKDFSRLVEILRAEGIKADKESCLIELGPGPTPLLQLKEEIFRSVTLIDSRVYEENPRNWLIADLSTKSGLDTLQDSMQQAVSTLVFADHCLEHLPENSVIQIIELAIKYNSSIAFRVPNIYSRRGRKNYENDNTHKTDFRKQFRNVLRERNLKIVPYFRYHDIGSQLLRFVSRQDTMKLASEVLIFGKPK